jgi:imidazole glycerol-phosphate synthase subunit HisF
MLKHRVIPCLLLKNGGLVKTVKFKDSKYVGDPINAIRIFNDKEVDELIVLDISASKSAREPNYELISKFASECFMPVCYGGGITSLEQAKRIFSLGIEKVSLQTSVLSDLTLVTRLAEQFGSQSILVSIDIKKNLFGNYRLYSFKEGKTLDMPWTDYLQAAVDAGAGEIVLNAVDRDGMMAGMDLTLIRQTTGSVKVPVIALGGVGSLAHIREAVDAGASAVGAGSFFVFHGPHRAVLITYPKYKQLQELFEK